MADAQSKTLIFGKKTLTTRNAAFIMGIVNCTNDSFFSGSRGGLDESVERALRLIDQGADVLDLGGESTRPGSEYVDEEEEIRRVLPVLEEIRKHSDIPVSIDTRKLAVIKACVDSGADVLNDVSSLEDSEGMAEYVAQSGIGLILMHKRGIPSDMQNDTSYGNVFEEVSGYLSRRCDFAQEKGVDPSKIIVDPGIGFGKNLGANMELIGRCGELCGGKYPVLMALSRKSFLGEITGRPVEERLSGTVTSDIISVLKGASMVRVHDVDACRDSLMVLQSFIDFGYLA